MFRWFLIFLLGLVWTFDTVIMGRFLNRGSGGAWRRVDDFLSWTKGVFGEWSRMVFLRFFFFPVFVLTLNGLGSLSFVLFLRENFPSVFFFWWFNFMPDGMNASMICVWENISV